MIARTVTLPINPDASGWDDFAWPEKLSGDNLDYVLDCAAWLKDGGRTLLSADAFVLSNSVWILGLGYGAAPRTQAILQLAGGVPGTRATVVVTLYLNGGRRLTVQVALPIGPDLPTGLIPFVPSNALLAGGQALTIGGALLVP